MASIVALREPASTHAGWPQGVRPSLRQKGLDLVKPGAGGHLPARRSDRGIPGVQQAGDGRRRRGVGRVGRGQRAQRGLPQRERHQHTRAPLRRDVFRFRHRRHLGLGQIVCGGGQHRRGRRWRRGRLRKPASTHADWPQGGRPNLHQKGLDLVKPGAGGHLPARRSDRGIRRAQQAGDGRRIELRGRVHRERQSQGDLPQRERHQHTRVPLRRVVFRFRQRRHLGAGRSAGGNDRGRRGRRDQLRKLVSTHAGWPQGGRDTLQGRDAEHAERERGDAGAGVHGGRDELRRDGGQRREDHHGDGDGERCGRRGGVSRRERRNAGGRGHRHDRAAGGAVGGRQHHQGASDGHGREHDADLHGGGDPGALHGRDAECAERKRGDVGAGVHGEHDRLHRGGGQQPGDHHGDGDAER